MIRNILVFLHRWIGLSMAGFLVVVGLTGSLLAFDKELERVFAAKLYAAPRPGVPPLDLATLMERAPAIPNARVAGATWNGVDQAGINYQPEIDPATKKPYELGFNQFFVDPWTGAELGRRTRGDISEGMINFMPFVLKLHDALLVRGAGTLILGIVAVFWTLDCFNGFYLTLPVSLTGFWRKWKAAWLIKRGAGAYRLNFDLHRASGLWLWPILLVFAWSSVMFNLRPVYDWTMSKLMEHHSMLDDLRAMMEKPRRAANAAPTLELRAGLETAQRLAEEQARKNGRPAPDQPTTFAYIDKMGVYFYVARSSGDAHDGFLEENPTLVILDGDTGAPVDLPLLAAGTTTRDLIDRWLGALHMAHVFGLPYKIFVCALGLVIAMLSATGVYIWWKKRKARRFRKTQAVSLGKPLEAAVID
ncbi:PepSY-associated TM helix domain-containing protein [Methylosinus sp. LW4]|uniref:PepSY-associated TM helix domain-containing protein n=1 Tax=Methylosinus sp. LW4 TaxID=136993 RepID=UPI000374F124|nr:PepSY-associated TM helix domain-containing protein [Methylosinus sp. LW4]